MYTGFLKGLISPFLDPQTEIIKVHFPPEHLTTPSQIYNVCIMF